MKKFLKILAITLAVLIVLLLLVFLFWLGPTVKTIAQSVGSNALGTPLTIHSLSINPRNGTLLLSDFEVENQHGFSQDEMVSLKSLSVAINMKSLFSDTIIIDEILIDQPQFTYEQNTDINNVSAAINNLYLFADIDPDALEDVDEVKEPSDPSKPAKKLIIKQLRIQDVKMVLAHTIDPELNIHITLDELALSMESGLIRLHKFAITNPGALTLPNLFELESIEVQIDPLSVYSEKVIIENVQISQPHLFLEQNMNTDTVEALMAVANSFIPPNMVAPTTKPEAPEPTQPLETDSEASNTAPPLELHTLFVDDIRIEFLGQNQTNQVVEIQTLFSIDKIACDLSKGAVQIAAIHLPNVLDSFESDYLFNLNSIDITLDPASIFSDQVVITEVKLSHPSVHLEQTETTGNVTELIKVATGFIPPQPTKEMADTSVPVPEATTEEETPVEPMLLSEQPVILQSLIVTNLSVQMRTSIETWSMGSMASDSLGMINPMNLLEAEEESEEAAPEEDETPLTLFSFNNLRLTPLEGRLDIMDLRVGNPKGFAHKNIVQLDQFLIELDADSLFTDTLLIENILIDRPHISYERKLRRDNISALLDFVEATTHHSQAMNGVTNATTQTTNTVAIAEEPVAEPVQEQEVEAAPAQKVIITKVLVKDGLVKAKLSKLPSAPIPLPDIEMNDIGKESGGTSITEVASKIGTTLYDAIIGSVSGISGFATDGLKGTGSFISDGASGLTGFATDRFKGAEERVVTREEALATRWGTTTNSVEQMQSVEMATEAVPNTAPAEEKVVPKTKKKMRRKKFNGKH